MSSININIEFPVVVHNEGSFFVASCAKVDIHAEGSTYKQAMLHIVEALDVFVVSCIEMGTLEKVLKECGYNKIAHAQEEEPNLDEEMVSVPISLLAMNHDNQAYAH